MKLFFAFLVAFACCSTLFIGGCSETGDQILTPSFSEAKEYFASVINNDEFFTTEEPSLEDGEALPASYGLGQGKANDLGQSVLFGKKIEKVRRDVTYEQESDTVVIATVTKTITGQFLVIRRLNHPGLDTLVRKPFVETATRKARFLRVGSADLPPWKAWKLDAISLLLGGTENDDVVIKRLVVQFENEDSIVVTSPSEYFLKIGRHPRPVPDWRPGQRAHIRLTLVSTSSDTEVVVLRHGAAMGGAYRLRTQFKLISEAQEGSSYVRTFEATVLGHSHYGKFNAVAEAIMHDSIYDDAAPLKNNYWGVPYVVK